MSNSFVTAKQIAERALPLLVEKIKMLGLVTAGDYDEAFTHKAGDTIQVRKPIRGSVVDGSGDISSSIQDIKDEAVEIQLSNQATYPAAATSKQMSLNIDDFTRQVTLPAITTIAEDINSKLLALYKDIPYYYGTSGTTPSTLADIALGRKILQNNKAPLADRSFVMDPDAEAKFLQLDSLVELDKSGMPDALRNAVLGKVYDILMVSDTMVPTHTAGGYTALADVTITAGASGATSIELTSAAGASTATLLKGDIFSIDDYQFVVTANTAAASSGVIAAVSIYPALPKAYGDFTSAAVTFPDVTARAHVPNLMFQKDAFALAMAQLPEVPGAENAVVSYDGFSIRVVRDYDFYNDKTVFRFDVLYGVATTYPELAARILG